MDGEDSDMRKRNDASLPCRLPRSLCHPASQMLDVGRYSSAEEVVALVLRLTNGGLWKADKHHIVSSRETLCKHGQAATKSLLLKTGQWLSQSGNCRVRAQHAY